MKRKKRNEISDDGYFVTDLFPPGSSGAEIVGEVDNRILVRPEVHLASTICFIVAALVFIAAVGVMCGFLCGAFAPENYFLSPCGAGWIGSGITAVGFFIVFKKALPIWCIKVYQRYATDDVRKRCLFTPSCSEYMILSIEKYGAVRGIIKGIKRLRRCHAPNGGEDYP